ncbi:hypothetical protein ACN42_g2531, partial [Penicillium freii]
SWLECDANNVKVEGSTPSGTNEFLFFLFFSSFFPFLNSCDFGL